ncbi:spore germination protein [Peribacillus frigoritolerans]|uniref:spore germination protein n=1 Tax=Peribacillus frigoritolerans TaxID=450367 RepID=UPI0022274259|nr:spore germination protein [Peribacillus frigoritolerans]UYY96938.1 spore germination protein [Peribacillus frigoritolerans]
MRFKQHFFKNKKEKEQNLISSNEATKLLNQTYLSTEENISYIKQTFSNADDMVIKEIKTEKQQGVIVYLETMADKEKIHKYVITPIIQAEDETIESFLVSEFQTSTDLNKAIEALITGSCVIFLDDFQHFFFLEVSMSNNRAVMEPENEMVIQGSHEGFIENLLININLIRKEIKSPDLCLHYVSVGEKVKSKIAVVYMKKLANEEVIQEIKLRIGSISTDTLINTGFLEEFIEDSSFSPFPQILSTERIDRVIGNLNEGRAAILMEGCPTCLLAPVTFFAFYQSPDDYNSRWMPGTFVRALRLVSFIISIGLPAFYISVIAFNFEVLPDDLLLPVKNSIYKIPFPPLVEVFIMELTIELIREAGIRLPSRIGQTIGIVGGLVIGDAIVRAGLISNVMIVVVALTAISSFVIPNHEMSASVRLLRFPFMILAASFGFVGMVFGFMVILSHLCKLESFGTPYFAPLAPFKLKDLKDTFLRLPAWTLNTRQSDSQPNKLKQQSSSRGRIYHDRKRK